MNPNGLRMTAAWAILYLNLGLTPKFLNVRLRRMHTRGTNR